MEGRRRPTVADFCCSMSSPRLFFKELGARQDWAMVGAGQEVHRDGAARWVDPPERGVPAPQGWLSPTGRERNEEMLSAFLCLTSLLRKVGLWTEKRL